MIGSSSSFSMATTSASTFCPVVGLRSFRVAITSSAIARPCAQSRYAHAALETPRARARRLGPLVPWPGVGRGASSISPVAIFATWTAQPTTSAGRFWPCGPLGISGAYPLGIGPHHDGLPLALFVSRLSVLPNMWHLLGRRQGLILQMSRGTKKEQNGGISN